MDIDTLVRAVTSGVERPDFSMDNPWFQQQVQHSINMAHSLGWFQRDLAASELQLIQPQETQLIFNLPAGYRELAKDGGITLFDAQGNPLICDYAFVKGKYNYKPKDYFDYAAAYYYYIFGNALTANFPASSQQQQIQFTYYQFPQLTYDEGAGKYVCDSWILQNWPGLIMYDLMRAIGTITNSDQETTLIRQYNEAMVQMMGDINEE